MDLGIFLIFFIGPCVYVFISPPPGTSTLPSLLQMFGKDNISDSDCGTDLFMYQIVHRNFSSVKFSQWGFINLRAPTLLFSSLLRLLNKNLI